MAFKITGGNDLPGNRWSASPLRYGGDRGSIAKSLMQRRWQRGLHRPSGIGRNVKAPFSRCWTRCC